MGVRGYSFHQERTIALGTTGTASASWSVRANIPLRKVGDGDIVWGASGRFGGGTAVPGLTNSATAPLRCAVVGSAAGDGDIRVADETIGLSFRPVYGVVSVMVPRPTALIV